MFRRHPLLKLLAVHLGIGIVASIAVVGGLMLTDAHRLRTLVAGDDAPVLTFVLLLFGFVVTLGSIAMSTAVMTLSAKPDDEKPPGGTPVAVPVRRAAVPVRAADQR